MSDIKARKIIGEHMMVLRVVQTKRGFHYAADCISCGTTLEDGTKVPKRLHEFHAPDLPAATALFDRIGVEHMSGSALGQHIANLIAGF